LNKTSSDSAGDFYYLCCNATGGCGASQIVHVNNMVLVFPQGWELLNEPKKTGMETLFLCPACVKDAERYIANGFKECVRCQNKTSVSTLCPKCLRNSALARKRKRKIESATFGSLPYDGK
jgi:ribosomal protein L37AE/L43A